MTWEEIRPIYPHQWLVVEAIGAYTEKGKRIINNLQVVGEFGDEWKAAWDCYRRVHDEDKWREYYVLHTDRVELNIGVLNAFRGPLVTEE